MKAKQMKDLVDIYHRDADLIRLVADNFNIHTPETLYELFAPQEARRIVQKLEFHYTPKHTSCLNEVEIELSVLSRQCLERRIPDIQHYLVKLLLRRNNAISNALASIGAFKL